MHTLTVNVIYATGLRREIARAAISDVLLFLLKEIPGAHIAEFIERMPQARHAVEEAAADGNGDGRSAEDVLTEKLKGHGLNQTQITALINEIAARAKTLLSAEDVAKVRQVLLGLSENVRSTSRAPKPYRAQLASLGRAPSA